MNVMGIIADPLHIGDFHEDTVEREIFNLDLVNLNSTNF